jgi:hypothetical protein
MFCISNFIKTHIINGFQAGQLESDLIDVLAHTYCTKGLLNDNDMQDVLLETMPKEITEDSI